MKQPLAFRMRPKKVDDILGQDHLLGENKVLRKCIESNQLFSMIFFGPPGTGKTTTAMCIANELKLPYRLFNAVTGNKKDLEIIFEETKFTQGLVVIIDEVHRLNKDKQDLLLPYIESGNLIMIGATTANPYHSINPAIRSRNHLFEIKPLQEKDIATALYRAVESPDGLDNRVKLDSDAALLIAHNASGDLRYALNLLEICALDSQDTITKEKVIEYSARPNLNYDKDDSNHYDTVSAFQKSIRGSDVNAALYYLAKLISANDLESIERRLLVIAYEDIGLANPAAVDRCINAIDTVKRVGFPEGRIPLAFTVIDLCLSPKSKSAISAIDQATAIIQNHDYPIPEYLRLTPVLLSEEDKYDYDRPDIWHKIQYLPNAIKNEEFYTPWNTSQYEKQLAKNYEELKKEKRSSNLRKLKNEKK